MHRSAPRGSSRGRRGLHGTRDAPANFQREVTGSVWRTVAVYCHQSKKIRTVVRGDDFVLISCQEGLDWLHDRREMRLIVNKKVIRARENEGKE